jgi:hypothetical protein
VFSFFVPSYAEMRFWGPKKENKSLPVIRVQNLGKFTFDASSYQKLKPKLSFQEKIQVTKNRVVWP